MQTLVKFRSFRSSFDQYFDIPAKSRFHLFFLTFSENSALLKLSFLIPIKGLDGLTCFFYRESLTGKPFDLFYDFVSLNRSPVMNN